MMISLRLDIFLDNLLLLKYNSFNFDYDYANSIFSLVVFDISKLRYYSSLGVI